MLNGSAAHQFGIADALFEPADFLEQSLAWAARILTDDDARRQVAIRRADIQRPPRRTGTGHRRRACVRRSEDRQRRRPRRPKCWT